MVQCCTTNGPYRGNTPVETNGMQTRVPARNVLCTPAECVQDNKVLRADVTVEMVSDDLLMAEVPIKPQREDPPIPTVFRDWSQSPKVLQPSKQTHGPQSILPWDNSLTRLSTIAWIQSEPLCDQCRQEGPQPLLRFEIERSRGSQVGGKQRGESLEVAPHICMSCCTPLDIISAERGKHAAVKWCFDTQPDHLCLSS